MVMPICWEWGPSSVTASLVVSLLQNISGTFLAKFLLLGGAYHKETSLLILTGTLIAFGNSALTHRLSRNIRHLLLFPKAKTIESMFAFPNSSTLTTKVLWVCIASATEEKHGRIGWS